MARILGAVSLGLALAVGVWWLARVDTRPIGVGVVPEPSSATPEPTHSLDVESVRIAAEPPPERSAQPVALEATGSAPIPAATRRPDRHPRGWREDEDLTGLEHFQLGELERALSQELSTSTVDELRARYGHGLGDFVGAGPDFDLSNAWDPDSIMILVTEPVGTHWRVTLPRREYPDAYALFDRRLAVRTEIERRDKDRRTRTEAERTARE